MASTTGFATMGDVKYSYNTYVENINENKRMLKGRSRYHIHKINESKIRKLRKKSIRTIERI